MPTLIEKLLLNPEHHQLRSGWQVLCFFLLWLTTNFLLLSITYGLIAAVSGEPDINKLIESKGQLNFLIIASQGLITALLTSAVCARYLAKRSFASIGYDTHQGWARDLGIGAIVALLMVSLVVLLQWLSRGTEFVWQPPSLAETLRGLSQTVMLLFISAAVEELLFRGFPMQALAKNLHPGLAALLMSVPFGLVHIDNPNHTLFATINTILAGLWLAMAYFKTRSLWFATGLHTAWNFSLGALYGLPVSGYTQLAKTSLFSSVDHGPNWLTGSSYGPEAGASATLVLLIALLWLWKTKWLRITPEMARHFTKKRDNI
ncbi:MAG: type II CAAX endopeptidase family protein [Acidobacteriota bacterium]